MVIEMDTIKLKTNDGIDEEVELIFTVDKGKKKYLLYKKDNEIYASYLLNDELHNDLTEDEYKMLEKLYGVNYDK